MDDDQGKSAQLPFFLRRRGLFADVLIALAFCSGPPWWFESLLGLRFTCEQTILLTVVALAVLTIVIVVSMRVRSKLLVAQSEAQSLRLRPSAATSEKLEGSPRTALNMANRLRGIIQNCDERAARIKGDDVYDFVSSICDSLASVFQEEMGDQAIDCSIRLASPDHVRYETIGRFTRLNIDRKKHAEPATAKSFILTIVDYSQTPGVVTGMFRTSKFSKDSALVYARDGYLEGKLS